MQAPLAFIPGTVRAHRHLGAVPGLAGQRHDLDAAVGDLGHLQREQLAHQVGVGAREGDRGSLDALAHRDHVAAQPRAVGVVLAGHLLGRRQHRLDRAEVDVDHARVAALLHDAGDDVALAAEELAQHVLVLGVAQPLQDGLPSRGRGDPAEALRGVVPLPHQLAVIVELSRAQTTTWPLERSSSTRASALGSLGAVVGQQHGLLDGAHQHVERDLLLPFDGPEGGQVDVHQAPPPKSSRTCPRLTDSHGHDSPPSSVTPASSASLSRPSTTEPSTRCTTTSRPRARRQCRRSVSRRSAPGEVTSRVYGMAAQRVAGVQGGGHGLGRLRDRRPAERRRPGPRAGRRRSSPPGADPPS